jgi:hypothetical protein
MSTNYTDRLCTQVREAYRLPIDDTKARQRKLEVLEEAAAHPRAAAECVELIVGMYRQGLGSDRAMVMIEPFRAVETSDVRDAALAALEAVGNVRPDAVGTSRVLQALVDLPVRVPTDVERRVFYLVGQCGGYADGVAVERHLIDAIRDQITEAGWDAEVSPAAVEAIGGLLAADAPARERLIDLLETAFDTGLPDARAAVARAAGRGLTAESPPIDSLEQLLERALAASTLDVKRGAAVGACLALSGGDAARAIGESILDELRASPEADVRETVPRAIGETVQDATGEAAEIQADLLGELLDDEASNVQTAVVDAARQAIETREAVVEPFATVLETVLTTQTGEPNTQAADALDNPAVAEALAESTDEGPDRFQEALERPLITDPRQGGSEAALERIETFEGYFEPDSEDAGSGGKGPDEGGDEDDGETESEIDQGAEQLARTTRPSEFERLIDQAETERERAVVVEAVHNWLKQERLEFQSAVALWEALLSAWRAGDVDVRKRVVDATATGVARGHVTWDVAEELFDTARQSEPAALREATLVAVGRLLIRIRFSGVIASRRLPELVEQRGGE